MVVHVRGVCALESSSLCNNIVHEHVSGYIHVCVSTERFGLLHKCLYTLMCGFKIGDASTPVCTTKLKIIFGSKTNKPANSVAISIHIHMYYVYG